MFDNQQEQSITRRATREDLKELHGLLCESIFAYMRGVPPGKHKPAMLELIRQFLRDNGITKNLQSAQDVSESLEELTDLSIPFVPAYLGNDLLK